MEVFERITDAFFGLDRGWRFTYLNPRAEDLLKRGRDDLVGENVWDEFPKARGSAFQREYERAARTGEVVSFEEYYPPLGAWFEVTAYPSEEGLSVYFRDVTGRKKAEEERERMQEALLETERRLRAILVRYSSDVVTILEADGTVRYQSPAIMRVLGYDPEELVGKNAFDYLHPGDREGTWEAFAGAVGTPGPYGPLEYRFRHKDGSWRHLESIGDNLLSDPDVKGVVVDSRDVTERKLLQKQLEYQAFHDGLTGLPNRALFMERLERALLRAARNGARVAVLFMDLDGFKAVNDSLGHEAGDQLLVGVAERLGGAVRASDTAARLGGDEFAVLSEDVEDEADVRRIAERVKEALDAPFLVDGREVSVTASVGLAHGTTDPGKPKELLRDADAAMYRAKKNGTGYEVFDPGIDEAPRRARSPKRSSLEADLVGAVEREELVLHYQPKFRLGEGGGIAEVEALVRWEHPKRGLLFPAEFVPLAEETGLIVPVGRWVLGEACRRVKGWQERYPKSPPLVACVNLSPRQIRPGLLEDVGKALGESGLEDGALTLEITECQWMEDTEENGAVMRELRALGVRFAVDDFGKGYSSMSYLRRLPVDFLKVDRSFVAGLGDDPACDVLVEAMVTMAHTLGMETVGEGVETAGQLEQLERMGCDLVQGHYLAKPLPQEAVGSLLAGELEGRELRDDA